MIEECIAYIFTIYNKQIPFMKKVLATIVLAAFASACGGSTKTEAQDTTTVVVDTLVVPADTLPIGGGAGTAADGTVPTEQKK